MATGKFTLALLFFLCAGASFAQPDEQHIKVAMRRIGHEILLQSGDSTSRILPVRKEAGRYRIAFAADFRPDPDQLASTVDRILKESAITRSYVAELEQCGTEEIVHSYAIHDSVQPDQIACGSRILPKGCYVLFITLPNRISGPAVSDASSARKETAASGNYSMIAVSALSLFIFIGSLAYFRKKKPAPADDQNDPDALLIGGYRFDTKKMLLHYNGESTELSGKEADLLVLLHAHENTTLSREHLLKVVWGDEGDYVGRTLDVFVSKLRKKLEADPRVKIVNIRGVGYRLIVS